MKKLVFNGYVDSRHGVPSDEWTSCAGGTSRELRVPQVVSAKAAAEYPICRRVRITVEWEEGLDSSA